MKIVRKLLKEGKNKQEIFDKTTNEGFKQKKVAKCLARYPDPEEAEKYKKANMVLVGLCVALILLRVTTLALLSAEFASVVVLAAAIPLVIVCVATYFIFKMQPSGYLILCYFLAISTFHSFNLIQSNPRSTLLAISMSVFLIIYAVVLKYKIFPYQNFGNTMKDSDGIPIYTKDLTNA